MFVGGLQRSGTTLLSALLTENPVTTSLLPNHFGSEEGQFRQSVYKDDIKLGHEVGRGKGIHVRWAYHRDAHLVEKDAEPSPDRVASALLDAWRPHFTNPGAEYLIEKSPPNLMKGRFLQAAFPEARFIVITRHPVIQALAVRKWAPRHVQVGIDLGSIIDHWLMAMETFSGDLSSLKAVRVLRYDKLLASPASALEELQSFAGLPPHEAEVKRVSDKDVVYSKYWESMRQGRGLWRLDPLNRKNRPRSVVPRTLERLLVPIVGPREVDEIRMRFGERVRRFGYDIDDLSADLGWSV